MQVKTACLALVASLVILSGSALAAKLQVTFADSSWNGKKIPKGQHGKKFGGEGSALELDVSGIPEGATAILVEFNDASYQPPSSRGGHGIVGFEYAGGGEAVLPPVPGGTEETPHGTWTEKKNRATGAWKSTGCRDRRPASFSRRETCTPAGSACRLPRADPSRGRRRCGSTARARTRRRAPPPLPRSPEDTSRSRRRSR